MTPGDHDRGLLAGAAVATTRGVGPDAQMPRKDRAAAVSIASNALLIVLKLAAAAITGSIAILTEAMHSGIDLIASVVAFYSVRKADEPADEDHPYGHQKVENLAAAIEGMLILLGAGIIIFESVRRLAQGTEVESIGVGIAVIGFSAVANLVVSSYLYRRARATDSPALWRATPPTCAPTPSPRRASSPVSGSWRSPGCRRSTRSPRSWWPRRSCSRG